eukprot:scaffold5705_cov122-Isochrysis_galbana.AAC.6
MMQHAACQHTRNVLRAPLSLSSCNASQPQRPASFRCTQTDEVMKKHHTTHRTRWCSAGFPHMRHEDM